MKFNILHVVKKNFFTKKTIWQLIVMTISLIVTTLSFCINPLIFSKIFDVALPNKNISLLLIYINFIFFLFLIGMVARYVESIMTAHIAENYVNLLRLKLFESVQNLPIEQIYQRNFEETVIARFSEDLLQIGQTLNFLFSDVMRAILIGIFSLGLMCYINWYLTLLVITCIWVMKVIPSLFAKSANSYVSDKQAIETDILAAEKEQVVLQNLIRFLRIRHYKLTLFQDQIKKLLKITIPYNINLNLVNKSSLVILDLTILFVLSFGAYLVINNHLTLGNLIAFLVLQQGFAGTIFIVSSRYPILIKCRDSLKNIGLLTDTPFSQEKVKKEKQIPLSPLKEAIQLDNVSVKLNTKLVLSHIHLNIPAGQFVAVVGASGAGKSTLLHVLLNQLKPSDGKITYDGIDLKYVTENDLYFHIGIVSQLPKLFSTTIRENIRLGKLDASDDEIIEAAKMAEAHGNIMALPLGYDTHISCENPLSSGQLQRIAVARALIAKPSVLCLDEATSALDPMSADALDQTFRSLAGQVTILSITHRIHSTVHADKIYVLDQGKVVEEGTHDSLMTQDGLYSQFWEKQHAVTLSSDLTQAHIDIRWLKKISQFNLLDDANLKLLSESFLIENVEANQILFKENDFGNKFYIIVSGEIEISIWNKEIGKQVSITKLQEGDYFGELALLYEQPRNASATTNTNCILLTLYYTQFHKIFIQLPEDLRNKILELAKDRIKSTSSARDVPMFFKGKNA